MTGTWRDTLFIWQGRLTREECEPTASTANHRHNGTIAFVWDGSWIGVENCPDSRCVPTPTSESFEASTMKFKVSGTGSMEKFVDEDYSCHFWKLHLTKGPGWDLGEGAEKRQHQDQTHVIYMESKSPDMNESSQDMNAVVAMGVNEFGPFVSAGYRLAHSCEVIMGRRYLDDKDQRNKLTIEELYDRVTEADHGTYCLGSYVTWSNIKARRRLSPWRTLDMHAECVNGRSGKRKRIDEGRDRLETLPALFIPNETFSSQISIDVAPNTATTTLLPTTNRLKSHTRWLEQCNGCGYEISDRTKACCKEVTEYTLHDQQSHGVNVGCAYYCSEVCAQRNGAQSWADAGRQWTETMAGSGHFLKSNGVSGFWYAVQNDKAAMIVLLAAGWRKDFMDYILESTTAVSPL